MAVQPLAGFVIGVTADRRRAEQAELFERQGAAVVAGPALASATLGFDEALRRATADVLGSRPDYLLATTAVGLQGWLATASLWGLEPELMAVLGRARIAARGPKVVGAVAGAGLDAWFSAPRGTTAELVERVLTEPLVGRCVAVLRDGADAPATDGLRAAGARVIEVPLYRWTLPVDLRPAERLVEAATTRRLDAVTFTAAPAVHNLCAIAGAMGKGDALRAALSNGVVAACIGPVCAAAASAEGIDQPFQPPQPTLAGLVAAVTTELGARRRHLRLDGIDVVVQGTRVDVGGTAVQLSERERAVLDLLCARSGVVVSRSRLLRDGWPTSEPNAHAVDVTVARLRQRLGPAGIAIRTVPRRGYLLEERTA